MIRIKKKLIFTWVIQAEHTGAFPSFAWIKKFKKKLHQKLAPSLHQKLAPRELEVRLSYYWHAQDTAQTQS